MSEVSEILKKAMELPPEARAAIADSLLDSLDDDPDEGVQAAWDREIARRVMELDSGKAKRVPWPEVRRRMIEKLSNG